MVSLLPFIRLAKSILKRKSPSIDRPPQKGAFEKYKPSGSFLEFYGNSEFPNAIQSIIFKKTELLQQSSSHTRAEPHNQENLVIYPSEKFGHELSVHLHVCTFFGGGERESGVSPQGKEYVKAEVKFCISSTPTCFGSKSHSCTDFDRGRNNNGDQFHCKKNMKVIQRR